MSDIAVSAPAIWDRPDAMPEASRYANATTSRAGRSEASAIEAELMRRLSAGDGAALRPLYDRLGGPLYALAYQIVRDASSAEDVVQEVFVATWRHADRYDAGRGLSSELAVRTDPAQGDRTVRRETTSRSRTVESDLSLRPSADDVEQAAWLSVRSDRARAALASLSADQRDAVVLVYFGGLTHVEVADRLRDPLGTAKTRIRSGLLRLRDTLADIGRDE